MKIQTVSRKHHKGFTLVEMIGVLAIIAVLAALLVPRVFAAINDARVNSAVMSYNSARSAAMVYFGKYGRFGGVGGTPLTAFDAGVSTNWDRGVLLTEGLLDRPFSTRVAEGNFIVVTNALATTSAADGFNQSYNLDNNTTVVNDASAGTTVIQVVLTGVALDDAREINKRIDGDEAAFGDGGTTTDTVGRVKYNFGAGSSGTVLIYLAHK
jgi:prepilin-type N-terminal cleavage/methylation domain-containing protein